MNIIWPKKYFWQYKTSQFHPFDYSVRFILRPLMKLRANGKISHWWHWKMQPNKSYKGLLLKGNLKAFPRTHVFSKIWMSLGGWKTIYILEPKDKRVKQWFFAYSLNDNTIERCSLILEGPIRILQGPGSYFVIGLDKNNKEIELRASGPFNRSDKGIIWPII